ncbi:MAG: cytochrome c oxidase assembly protein [Rhizobiales bacterium]|jgi:putative membrane protein|nr:cytochrome c oxidase assembly protein [Hyphomicrobiales bacterium]
MADIRAEPVTVWRSVLNVDGLVYAVIIAAAIATWGLGRNHAAALPSWAPWEFSWVEFLTGWLSAWWYVRGLTLTPADERPSPVRGVAFFAGLLVVYGVLETRFEYLAEHQFFFNRIQHVAMHHVGPLLLALAWPGATLSRGMPAVLLRALRHPVLTGLVRVLQQPVLAAVLFVGSFFFWLVPSIHFQAMIDPRLFTLMNWTMVVEGILFWCLVLDPRPAPPARASFAARAALAVVVMFPQIIGGAMIAFNPHNLYTFYDLCGRIYPGLGAHYDQTVGGMIIWIPPAMMSVLALVLVLNALRRCEERENSGRCDNDNDTRPVIDARSWTGG